MNIVYDTVGVFHPKFYLFENETSFSLLTGSSNFTAGGFHKNIESNVLIKGNKSEPIFSEIVGFYRLCKEKSRIPDDSELETYEAEHEKVILNSSFFSTYDAPEERKELVTKAGDSLPDFSWENIFQFTWDEYVHGLKFIDLYRNFPFKIFYADNDGIRMDSLNTLEKSTEFIHKSKTLSAMENTERKFFCGTADSGLGNSGWFGSMSGAGYFKNMVIEKPGILDEHLNLISLTGSISEEAVRKYLDGLTSIDNVSFAIALRLLSMKRPDLFLSINKANTKGLIEMTGLNGLKNSQKKEEFIEAYIELHKRIYRSPWFQFNLPTEGIESKIAKYRVASLDCFFYEG